MSAMNEFKVVISTEQILKILAEHTPEERNKILQVLAIEAMGYKTQVCGWCYTAYAEPADASACAKRCGPAAGAVVVPLLGATRDEEPARHIPLAAVLPLRHPGEIRPDEDVSHDHSPTCGHDDSCGASLSARCFNGEAGCRVHKGHYGVTACGECGSYPGTNAGCSTCHRRAEHRETCVVVRALDPAIHVTGDEVCTCRE